MLPWVVAGIGALVGAAGILADRSDTAAPREPVRFIIETPDEYPPGDAVQELIQLAISPDGRRVAFVAGDFLEPRLYVRELDSLDARLLPGTERARGPFFSPDGRSVGFLAGNEMKKISIDGGTPLTITNVSPVFRGANWGVGGTILYAPGVSFGLFQVSDGGGAPEAVTTVDAAANEVAHLWPQLLPDGDSAVFTLWEGGSFDEARIELISLETGERRTLLEDGSFGRVTASGHLLFVRSSSLLAVPFDFESQSVTGAPVPVLDSVAAGPATGAAHFDVAQDGTLAYIPAGAERVESLVWVSRAGKIERAGPVAREISQVRLSPDGSRVAAVTFNDLWTFDLNRDSRRRVTFRGQNTSPVWSPDGAELAFSSSRISSQYRMFSLAVDGSSTPARLTAGDRTVELAGSWSPDGVVAFAANVDGPGRNFDIGVVGAGEPSSARVVFETPFLESQPMFSPDGRWLAYVTDESGRDEVFVRAFPEADSAWPISANGGTEPMWSPDGSKLYYRGGGKMYEVDIETEPSFRASRPRALFDDRFKKNGIEPVGFSYYDVAPDGERFLMTDPGEAIPYENIHVVLDWFEDLERLVPTKD